jgi:solute carrier family 25 protein 39/40
MSTPTVGELTNSQRIMSASAGALLTSLSVTPFDVIKVRLQSQRPVNNGNGTAGHTHTHSHAHTPTTNGSGQSGAMGVLHKGVPRAALVECTHYHLHTGIFVTVRIHMQCLIHLLSHDIGLTDVWCRKCDMTPPVKASSRALPTTPLRFTGSIDAAVKLIQYEGVTSLWRGLAPTLVLSIPSTVVYFNLYDQLKRECERNSVPYPPLVAGITFIFFILSYPLTTTLITRL